MCVSLAGILERCNKEVRATKALQDELEVMHTRLAKAIESQPGAPYKREIKA